MTIGKSSVGNLPHQPGQTADERSMRSAVCAAMALQDGGLRHHESAPQKLVQLVGCRDPEARLRANAIKR